MIDLAGSFAARNPKSRLLAGCEGKPMNLVIQFSYLQLLDVLTTLAFLAAGVGEANPIVRFVLAAAPNPLCGLLAVKAVAIGLALYCWRTSRTRLLSAANVFFACLVTWNLIAVLAA